MANSKILSEIHSFMQNEIQKGYDPEDLIMNTINYCVLELTHYQSKEEVYAFLQEQSTLYLQQIKPIERFLLQRTALHILREKYMMRCEERWGRNQQNALYPNLYLKVFPCFHLV